MPAHPSVYFITQPKPQGIHTCCCLCLQLAIANFFTKLKECMPLLILLVCAQFCCKLVQLACMQT